ncbi:hypothetical protein MA16_Dca002178 [Dendrobium catenatum]|uniref:RNase H type-1 domain-containing protein n=1 Tax=Dendrobium catenatum TaxID=906689 RepID=A0A2I0XEK2_9ASPA|nr:hypothetical protein MA16_Dca002178 [Dendrobium catenatum]
MRRSQHFAMNVEGLNMKKKSFPAKPNHNVGQKMFRRKNPINSSIGDAVKNDKSVSDAMANSTNLMLRRNNELNIVAEEVEISPEDNFEEATAVHVNFEEQNKIEADLVHSNPDPEHGIPHFCTLDVVCTNKTSYSIHRDEKGPVQFVLWASSVRIKYHTVRSVQKTLGFVWTKRDPSNSYYGRHLRNKVKHGGVEDSAAYIASNVISFAASSYQNNLISESYGVNQPSQLFCNYWHPPPPEWTKINIDATLLRFNKAGVGGFVRDKEGRFLLAFGLDSCIGILLKLKC